jgi:hypothetical protein
MKYIPTIFLMLILLTIWSCEDMGEPILEGCMTETACNYDADATLDDGSCTSETDVCGTCGGTIQELSDCCTESEPADCANVCGGSSVEDDCGVCDTNSLNDNTTCTQDCLGAWGGNAEIDCAGICEGSAILDGSTCTNISYSGFVKPTFVSNGCTGCHGTQGGLNLSSHTTLMLGNSNHGPVVIPFNGSGSLLIQKLRGTAPNGVQMPANSGCCLDDGGAPTIDLIEIWIDEGAENN